MDDGLVIGLAGATGAVGRELLAALDDAPFPVAELRPFASPESSVHTLEFRGEDLLVRELGAGAVEGCDVLLLAVPPRVAAGILPELRGTVAVDLSGVLGPPTVPLHLPGVTRLPADFVRGRGLLVLPRPLPAVLGTLLAPLRRRVGGLQLRGLALHSAASRGRGGVEELSQQVVALFTQREPRHERFPQGLAFDVEPAPGGVEAGGWTEDEQRSARELSWLLSIRPEDVAITEVVAPWFNALAAGLHVVADRPLGRELLLRLLGEAPGVALVAGDEAEALPRPRALDREGRFVRVGRVRDDPAGQGVHLWAVADELRFGAAGIALRALEDLLEAALIGDD